MIRSALVIASDEYQDPGLAGLRAPVTDASALGGVLADPRIGGFEARTLGWRFLDKIVQLPISLPVLRSEQASAFLGTALVGWPGPLSEAEIPDQLKADLLVSEDLCTLLTSQPAIGTTTAGYLCPEA